MDIVQPDSRQRLLLRACLLSGSGAQEAWAEWTRQTDFDQIDFATYKLLPLLTRNRAFAQLQDPIFEKCKGIYRRTWVENQTGWRKLLPVLEHLLKSGVSQIVLLKGMAMILRYYKDFGARVIGDVDILIPRSEAPFAVALLRSSGWSEACLIFDPQNGDFMKRYHGVNFVHPTGLNLDLHWGFIPETTPLLDESVLKHSQLVQTSEIALRIPSPTDLLLQTCVHGLKPSPVPLIRWIPDAMTILNASLPEIDWDRMVYLARKARICRPLHLALRYLIEEFEAPIPEYALEKLTPSFRLEYWEFWFHSHGSPYAARWCRFCLQEDHLTLGRQILHLPRFLQTTAHLKSPWAIPFYGLYWIGKRLYRRLVRFLKVRESKHVKL